MIGLEDMYHRRVEHLVHLEEMRRQRETQDRVDRLSRSLHAALACALAYRLGRAHGEFEVARVPAAPDDTFASEVPTDPWPRGRP